MRRSSTTIVTLSVEARAYIVDDVRGTIEQTLRDNNESKLLDRFRTRSRYSNYSDYMSKITHTYSYRMEEGWQTLVITSTCNVLHTPVTIEEIKELIEKNEAEK